MKFVGFTLEEKALLKYLKNEENVISKKDVISLLNNVKIDEECTDFINDLILKLQNIDENAFLKLVF